MTLCLARARVNKDRGASACIKRIRVSQIDIDLVRVLP